MKCARCAHDSKRKERTGGKCPRCQGLFAFDPKDGDPVTDAQFQHAIDVVSGNGAVHFHPRHVRWQLERQMKDHRFALLAVFIAVLVIGTVAASAGLVALGVGWLIPLPICTTLALGVFLVIRAIRRPRLAQLSNNSFDTLWRRWLSVHDAPSRAIVGTVSLKRIAMRDEELEQYSFDRAVICDNAAVVDVLLKNRFHFENNCAVLGVDGHPASAFEIVRRMLRNNPKLLVLAVHDASVEGCRLAHRLRTDPAWFPDHVRIVDVGLRPAHARYFPRQITAAPPGTRVAAGDGITPDEAAWLSRYRLDVMAIRPEQLIKRLFRAMTDAEQGGDGGIVYLGTDSGTTDGGADSFG